MRFTISEVARRTLRRSGWFQKKIADLTSNIFKPRAGLGKVVVGKTMNEEATVQVFSESPKLKYKVRKLDHGTRNT